MYTVQLNVHVQMSSTEELQVVAQIASKLDSIMEVAGIWRPVNSMTDRDRIVSDLSKWLCLGRTRPSYERYVGCKW